MSWSGQFAGIGKESPWGTEVARTEWYRFYSGSMAKHLRPSKEFGYLQNRDPGQLFYSTESGEGKLRLPMAYDGMTSILEMCFGGAPSGTTTKTYTLPTTVGPGWSLELHMGLPDASLESWLATGAKCQEFGIDFRVGEEVVLDLDFSAQKVVQDQKTASPTYPTYATRTVVPSQVTLTVDGTPTSAMGVSFRVGHNLKTDRGFLGSAYIGEQPFAPGFRSVTGTILKEWESKTLYDKFISGATAAIVVTCTGPGGYSQTWTFNTVQFTGETPEPGEGGIADQSLPWHALDDVTHTAAKLVHVTPV